MTHVLSKSGKLVMVLAIMGSLCFSGVAKAESSFEEGGTLLNQTVVNEYDMFKEFTSKSTETLLSEGFSSEEIQEQKSLDYKAEMQELVDKLAKVNTRSLEKAGHSPEQIEIIQNYTGTEDQIYGLSASLAFSTYYGASSASSSRSEINFRTDWTWSSAPIWLNTDIVAVPWSEEMYLDSGSSYTYGKYDLHDEWDERYQTTQTVNVTADLNRGAYIKIDMGYHNNDVGGLYAKKGKFGYKLFKSDLVKEVAIQPTYGHSQLNVTSPTVSFPWGVSVEFEWGVNKEASEYIYKKL